MTSEKNILDRLVYLASVFAFEIAAVSLVCELALIYSVSLMVIQVQDLTRFTRFLPFKTKKCLR